MIQLKDWPRETCSVASCSHGPSSCRHGRPSPFKFMKHAEVQVSAPSRLQAPQAGVCRLHHPKAGMEKSPCVQESSRYPLCPSRG